MNTVPDSSYIIERRRRIRKATKAVLKKRGNAPFTAREIMPHVKKQLWSYERWGISTQRIAQALRHLHLEGLIEKVGSEPRKRYPATIYQVVGTKID